MIYYIHPLLLLPLLQINNRKRCQRRNNLQHSLVRLTIYIKSTNLLKYIIFKTKYNKHLKKYIKLVRIFSNFITKIYGIFLAFSIIKLYNKYVFLEKNFFRWRGRKNKVMKKIFKITLIMFLASSILQILLNYIINEQILSRLLFGVDYRTFFMDYYRTW